MLRMTKELQRNCEGLTMELLRITKELQRITRELLRNCLGTAKELKRITKDLLRNLLTLRASKGPEASRSGSSKIKRY